MTTTSRQMIFATFIHNAGAHPGGWRFGEGPAQDLHDFAVYARLAQTAERGKFHCYFSGDAQGYHHISGSGAFSATDNAGKLEPTTLLAALSQVTQSIGLVSTASTTYNEPYAIARRFASLDHLTAGRAGWNVVTSATENEAHNFGRDLNMDHDQRYERAEEFVDVVRGLWDSWEDGSMIRDKAAGRYFEPAKVHALNHKGRHFTVSGPLNVGRPPQGHPVVVQAGGSEPGRALAARTADLVFTAQPSLEKAQAFYADMKARVRAFGRNPDHVKIIPSMQILVRPTEAEAKRDTQALLGLIPLELAVGKLEMLLGDIDLSGVPLAGPLPEIGLTNAGQWVQQQIIAMARDENLTVEQLARRVSVSRASFAMAGTPEQVADMFQQWFEAGAADGFSISPNYLDGNLDDIVDQVIPILQARGLFRTDYVDGTLRDNLGLPRPENMFVADPALGGEPDIWKPLRAAAQ